MPVGAARNKAWANINHMIAEQAPAIPYLWDKTALVALQGRRAVANGYYTDPRPELHLPEVGGHELARTTPEVTGAPSSPTAGGAPPQGFSPAPPKAMIPFIIRRLLWMVVLLLVISFLTFVIFYTLPAADPATLRAGRQPVAGAAGVDPPHAGARQALVHPVPEVPRAARLPLRLRLQLPEQRLGQVADLRPPARHHGAVGRRRDRLAAGRDPGRDHLRHQARHLDGPRGDGLARSSRSRPRSTGSASSRSTCSPRTSASSRSSRARAPTRRAATSSPIPVR